MELYEEVESKKQSKLTIIIGICIAILVIMTIAIIIGIMYLQKSILTIAFDGKRDNKLEKIIYITEDNEKDLYIPIREIAQFFGYEDHNGDYKIISEDKSKCNVKNEYETAMFTKDSDVLVKDRGDYDVEYITIDEKVFEIDGKLYTTPKGIEEAFNAMISYDKEKNKIDIYTMEYLNQYYASTLGLNGENGTISEQFADKKLIFEEMLIVIKNGQYGVINIATGKNVLEYKYEDIKYLPTTSEFLVKSNGKYGILKKDTTTNELITKIRFIYDDIKIMDNKSGLYLVSQNNLYGVLDANGKVIIELNYKQIGVDIQKFIQNGIQMENEYILLDEIIPVKNNDNLWAIFNTSGKQITDFEYTELGCSTTQNSNTYPALVIPSHKIIVVKKDQNYNLITTEGEELVPPNVLEKIYIKIDTETGENKFYMSYNEREMGIEEWLESTGR